MKHLQQKILASVSLMLLCFVFLSDAIADEPAGPRPIEGAEVTVAEGDYAVVVLNFQVPDAPGNFRQWQYIGGMRDGRLPIAHGHRLREPGGVLQRQGKKLSGTFVRAEDRRGDLVIAEVSVDATVEDDQISGTVTIDGDKGKVTGSITPAPELAKSNAVPEDIGWPRFLGPVAGGVTAQPTGTRIVDSFHDARVVWRSEETDIGEGIGSISRFMDKWRDASSRGAGSGSSSPIAGDGMIFLSYYVPSPERGLSQSDAEAMVEDAGVSSAEQLPARAREKIYRAADDVVVAMDAATGATRWKAVMPGRGVNHQHHKEGPFNMTPAYAEGRVFAIGMSGWLYALDAESGKPLWEVRLGGAGRGDLWSATVTALPGVVVAPQDGAWSGFDPATGERLWRSEVGLYHAAPAVWRHKGKDYLISGTGGNLIWHDQHAETLVCLDAKTGKTVWESRIPTVESGNLATLNSRGRGLGPGGITIKDDRMATQVAETVHGDEYSRTQRRQSLRRSIIGWAVTLDGPKELWRLPMTWEGSHLKPIVHGRFLFTGNLQVVDMDSGEVISQAEGVKPGNGGYMQAVEDVVFVRRDGTHGVIEFAGYRVSPEGEVTPMDPERGMWTPPVGGGTTSYHHPITYPLIDGRIYIRQRDGVYCWDLRRDNH